MGFKDLFKAADVLRMLNDMGFDGRDLTNLQNVPEARIAVLCTLHTYRLQKLLHDRTAQLRDFLNAYEMTCPIAGERSEYLFQDLGDSFDVIWGSMERKNNKRIRTSIRIRNGAYDVILEPQRACKLKYTITDGGRRIFVVSLGMMLDYWPIFDIRAYGSPAEGAGIGF